MVMSKARLAAEKGVRAARSRAVGRELIALAVPHSTGEENGHGLPATAIVPRKAGRAQLLDSPAPRSRWRWCPCCPFTPRILAARFPAAPPKALRKGARPLGTLKAILASSSSRGAGRPGHQQRRCSQLPLPAHLGQRGETPPCSKAQINGTNLGLCSHRRCAGDIWAGVTEHRHERHPCRGRRCGAHTLLWQWDWCPFPSADLLAPRTAVTHAVPTSLAIWLLGLHSTRGTRSLATGEGCTFPAPGRRSLASTQNPTGPFTPKRRESSRALLQPWSPSWTNCLSVCTPRCAPRFTKQWGKRKPCCAFPEITAHRDFGDFPLPKPHRTSSRFSAGCCLLFPSSSSTAEEKYSS